MRNNVTCVLYAGIFRTKSFRSFRYTVTYCIVEQKFYIDYLSSEVREIPSRITDYIFIRIIIDIYIIYERICRNIAKGYSRGRDKKGFFLIRITTKLLSKCYKI